MSDGECRCIKCGGTIVLANEESFCVANGEIRCSKCSEVKVPNDKAVEAARKALVQMLNPNTLVTRTAWGDPPTRQYEAEAVVEAAAPHIIEQYEAKRKTKCGCPELTPADEQEKVLSEQLKHYGVFNCDGDRVFLARQILAAGFCRETKGWLAKKENRKANEQFIDEKVTTKELARLARDAPLGNDYWPWFHRQLKGLIPK